MANFAAQERLRRSFAVWGLAIFGSLTSSGSVMLDHTSVWAADDPASHTAACKPLAPQSDGKETRTDDAGQEDASRAALTRGQLFKLLQARRTREATQRVDAALAAEPSAANYYLSYILASHLVGTDTPAAEERLKSIIAGLSDQLGESASAQIVSCYALSAQLLAQIIDGRDDSEAALAVLEEAAEKMAALPAPKSAGLMVQRCRILIKLQRADEAKAVMDQRVEHAFERAQQLPTLSNRMAVPAAISAYASLFRERYPEQVKTYRQKAEKLLLADLNKEDASPDDYLVYQALQIATALELGESDPKAASALLHDLQMRVARIKERLADDERKRLLPFEQTLRAALARIEAQLLQRELIGQPAPEFEIESVVNMHPVRWADLKGKVVLLDFWAVWCGPCVNSFPHMRKLQQEYAERGLVIISVTRPFGYIWDAASRRAIPKRGATLEEELAMLEEFRKEHRLEHGFIMLPRDSEYSKKLGVTGIPQAVVVDQNGMIQLIRVGANDGNASAIEAKIKELLDKPPQDAGDAR